MVSEITNARELATAMRQRLASAVQPGQMEALRRGAAVLLARSGALSSSHVPTVEERPERCEAKVIAFPAARIVRDIQEQF